MLGLLIVGCGQETGTADPESTPTAAGADGSERESDLFALDPCDLLETALEGQDFEPGERPDTRSDRACNVDKPGSIQTTLEFQDGPFDVLDGEVFEGVVNDRPARLFREPIEGASDGFCGVSVKVEDSQRALVFVTRIDRDTDEACDFAEELAEQVEPQLPDWER
ncbi:DUF3558 family protein [Haloechinothrix sp. LS1_15]|uniref:DUF3558 family protein n=1 Tax=Haloechinothrix sp. LS1_15 TaxID=2652248 RepID=UPI00294B580C|nr:DUF3558 family protein [Haloechinothrix sp. LS1_15]